MSEESAATSDPRIAAIQRLLADERAAGRMVFSVADAFVARVLAVADIWPRNCDICGVALMANGPETSRPPEIDLRPGWLDRDIDRANTTDARTPATVAPSGIVAMLRRRTEGGDVLEAAADEIKRLRRALAFARSVIKSGESWTETCERELVIGDG